MTTEPVPRYADRLDLGEGPRSVDGRVVLVDIPTGRLLAVPDDPAAPLETVLRLDVPLGAVAPVAGRPGTWIAAADTGICLLTPDGVPTWLARPEDGSPERMRMNDGTADPHGRFWAGSMAQDAVVGASSLYRVDPDGTVTRAVTGLTVPNGPAFTADGTLMYLADSTKGVIRRYPVDPATGHLGPPQLFATFTEGLPDGMTVDMEGALWVALWGTGAVHRYRADGSRSHLLRLPAVQPAGVCLHGDVLYVTTARAGLADPGPYDGAVFTVRTAVPGTPAAAYRASPTAV
ncbi:SMP-30/gluconolactonase/LRE family protein [Streptomyces sp. NPDC059578]|uniref:SMP-30/gluconolactonase/LRE family protein n=1 Tax=Streptomyces sp. NPDC059578 TaxID=3346874 RepID=UPI003690D513